MSMIRHQRFAHGARSLTRSTWLLLLTLCAWALVAQPIVLAQPAPTDVGANFTTSNQAGQFIADRGVFRNNNSIDGFNGVRVRENAVNLTKDPTCTATCVPDAGDPDTTIYTWCVLDSSETATTRQTDICLGPTLVERHTSGGMSVRVPWSALPNGSDGVSVSSGGVLAKTAAGSIQADALNTTNVSGNAAAGTYLKGTATNIASWGTFATDVAASDGVPLTALTDLGDLCAANAGTVRNSGDTANICVVPVTNVAGDSGSAVGPAVTVTGGAGIAPTSVTGSTLTLATASPETGFLADGGLTNLGAGNGSMQALDDRAQWRNGAGAIQSAGHREFNPFDYGGSTMGNGTVDDTTAINAATAACNTAGGGRVLLPDPPVAYTISSSILLYESCTLEGVGSPQGTGGVGGPIIQSDLTGPGFEMIRGADPRRCYGGSINDVNTCDDALGQGLRGNNCVCYLNSFVLLAIGDCGGGATCAGGTMMRENQVRNLRLYMRKPGMVGVDFSMNGEGIIENMHIGTDTGNPRDDTTAILLSGNSGTAAGGGVTPICDTVTTFLCTSGKVGQTCATNADCDTPSGGFSNTVVKNRLVLSTYGVRCHQCNDSMILNNTITSMEGAGVYVDRATDSLKIWGNGFQSMISAAASHIDNHGGGTFGLGNRHEDTTGAKFLKLDNEARFGHWFGEYNVEVVEDTQTTWPPLKIFNQTASQEETYSTWGRATFDYELLRPTTVALINLTDPDATTAGAPMPTVTNTAGIPVRLCSDCKVADDGTCQAGGTSPIFAWRPTSTWLCGSPGDLHGLFADAGAHGELDFRIATTQADTRYAIGGGASSANEVLAQAPAPSPMRLSQMRVTCTAAPGSGGNYQIRLRKNGTWASGQPTCTVTDPATTCEDLTGFTDYSTIGDLYNLEAIPSTSPAPTAAPGCFASFLMTAAGSATIPHNTVIVWGNDATASAADGNFCSPGMNGDLAPGCQSTTANGAEAFFVAPRTAVLSAMAVKLNSNTGGTETFTLHNITTGTDAPVACSITGANSACSVTSCSGAACTVNAGDRLTVRYNGTTETRSRKIALEFTGTGQWMTTGDFLTGATTYYHWRTNTTSATNPIYRASQPTRLRGLYVRAEADVVPAVTDGSTVLTATVMAGATSSTLATVFTCEIKGTAGADTGCEDVGHTVTLAAGDYWNVRTQGTVDATNFIAYAVEYTPATQTTGRSAGFAGVAPITVERVADTVRTALTPCAANQIYKRNAGNTAWECAADTGGNSFATIDAPAGTDPVADLQADTLQLLAPGPITVTGDSAADSVSFDCTSASGSVKGCLTSADWTTFNAKENEAEIGQTVVTGNATAAGEYIRAPGAGAGAWSTIPAADLPTEAVLTSEIDSTAELNVLLVDDDMVTVSGVQMISGDKTATGLSAFSRFVLSQATVQNLTNINTQLLSSTISNNRITIADTTNCTGTGNNRCLMGVAPSIDVTGIQAGREYLVTNIDGDSDCLILSEDGILVNSKLKLLSHNYATLCPGDGPMRFVFDGTFWVQTAGLAARSGGTLPPQCNVGDPLFQLTGGGAVPGSRIHACIATDTWAPIDYPYGAFIPITALENNLTLAASQILDLNTNDALLLLATVSASPGVDGMITIDTDDNALQYDYGAGVERTAGLGIANAFTKANTFSNSFSSNAAVSGVSVTNTATDATGTSVVAVGLSAKGIVPHTGGGATILSVGLEGIGETTGASTTFIHTAGVRGIGQKNAAGPITQADGFIAQVNNLNAAGAINIGAGYTCTDGVNSGGGINYQICLDIPGGTSWDTGALNSQCTAADTPHDCCTGNGTGTCIGNVGVRNGSATVFTAPATQSLTADTEQISCIGTTFKKISATAARNLTSDPQILDGISGQVCVIEATGAFTITLDDGTGIQIGAQIVLAANDTATFMYDGTDWVLVSTRDN